MVLFLAALRVGGRFLTSLFFGLSDSAACLAAAAALGLERSKKGCPSRCNLSRNLVAVHRGVSPVGIEFVN